MGTAAPTLVPAGASVKTDGKTACRARASGIKSVGEGNTAQQAKRIHVNEINKERTKKKLETKMLGLEKRETKRRHKENKITAKKQEVSRPTVR